VSAPDRTLLTVAGAACVACCLPLIVAAGPVVAVGGVAAATAGVAAHAVRRPKRKEIEAKPRDNP
jgi:hypothetical protein